MNRKRARGYFAASLAAFLVPLAVSAAGIVPCSGVGDCNLCTFVKLGQDIINFLIGISIPLAVALFAYAGVLYFTAVGDPHQVQKAHGIFKSVGIGFILILTAWIIVDTFIHVIVIPGFFKDISPNSTWYQVSCTANISGIGNGTSGSGGRQINGDLGTWFSSLFGKKTPPTSGGPGAPSVGQSSVISTQQAIDQGGFFQTIPVSATAADGSQYTETLPTTRSDLDLSSTYTSVSNAYGSQIQSACNSYGSAIPNCVAVTTALITVESSGVQTAANGSSVGLTQVQGDAAANCSTAACNINAGVKYLSQQYQTFGDLPNAIAAYNSGPTTQAGHGTGGTNTAMVGSRDCQGEYAWQCGQNPGGLTITRQYVANICRTLSVAAGSSC